MVWRVAPETKRSMGIYTTRIVCERSYVSRGQFESASTDIRSGRLAASSLYTVHDDANVLMPPAAAQLRVNKAKVSHTTSVWKGCSDF